MNDATHPRAIPGDMTSRDMERQMQEILSPMRRRDLTFLGLVLLAAFVLIQRFDLFERFLVAIGPREDTWLDEALMALAIGSIAMMVVTSRRWNDLRTALARSLAAEQALRKSEYQFRDLFTHAASGISRWTDDGRLIVANPAFEQTLGFTPVVGVLRLADLLQPADHAQLFEQLRAEGQVGPVEMEWRCNGKPVQVRLAGTLHPDGEGLRVDLITTNITSERSLELQLRHAQKMDAVGRLAGGIAHDFNNLLTVILNEADLARDALPPEDPTQTALIQISRASERASTLTRQLLTFSRRDVVNRTIFSATDMVNDMARMVSRLIGENVEVTLRTDARPALVHADRGQLEQVVINLVVNARDAMPSGGALIIETAVRTLDDLYAEHHVGVEPGEYVMLAVSDSGIGMEADIKERLFEPFFTTKRLGEGIGLGLATSYGIIKQSGGHIGVYSEPGKGTTMRVYLPRSFAPVESFTRGALTPVAANKGRTVLLAEDEAAVRSIAARILHRLGYNVVEAANGLEALRLAQTMQQPLDLVISDIMMPEMGGRELIERIDKIMPEARVLLMSGYTDDLVLKNRLLNRSVPFLQKPFTATDFAKAVHSVLHDEPVSTLGELPAAVV